MPPTPALLKTLLPALTFIHGPNGAGKTTLANLLFDEVPGLQVLSFAEPLRFATTGLFYEGDTWSRDLRTAEEKAAPTPFHRDGTPVTVRDFMNDFGDWLKERYGATCLGDIALNRVKVDLEHYDRFVFDDARRLADIAPLVSEFGSANTLIIDLQRPGVSFTASHFAHDLLPSPLSQSCRRVTLHNTTSPLDMLSTLTALLSIVPEPS